MTHLALFFGQALNFLLIVINIRACAKGYIGVAVLTDFLICLLGFKLIKLIGEAKTTSQMAAYAAGGTCGSALAILLTKAWDGH